MRTKSSKPHHWKTIILLVTYCNDMFGKNARSLPVEAIWAFPEYFFTLEMVRRVQKTY